MILITGATGFIGRHVIEELRGGDEPLRALVRPGSAGAFLERRGVELVRGDVTDPASLRAAVEGCRAVVHLVGLIREPPGQSFESVVAEGTRSLADAASTAGVERFVYVSAVGARRVSASRYQRTKALAEEAVRAGAFRHVILRPSVVFGPGDGLLHQYAQAPLPLPGGGANKIQPIYVVDFAKMIAGALRLDTVLDQTIEVGGPHFMTMRHAVGKVRLVTGRWLPHPPLPLGLAELNGWLFDKTKGLLYRIGFEPPLTRDLVLMLGEDNICDPFPASRAFGVELTPLTEGLRQWLAPRADAGA